MMGVGGKEREKCTHFSEPHQKAKEEPWNDSRPLNIGECTQFP